MQCWSCEFENIPGMQRCARCGGALNLDGVSVIPPRASGLRLATATGRLWHRLSEALPRLPPLTARLSFLLPEAVPWGALAWTLIPGVGHIKLGQRRLGWPILSAWLFFLLLSLFSLATNWTGLFLACMATVHAFALISILGANLAHERLPMRLLFGLFVFLGFRILLYYPVQRLLGQCLFPLPV